MVTLVETIETNRNMTEELQNKIKEIKRSFRFAMSGPTSQSMREKGAGYKINWGVRFIQLNSMAKY